jgi:uncharacterized protein (UPF0305 family)
MDILSFIYGVVTVLVLAVSAISVIGLKLVLKLRRSFDSFTSENDVYLTHMFDTLSKRIEDLKRDVLDEVRTNMRDTDYVDKRLGIISSELREEIYDLLVEVEKLKSK